MAFRYSTQGKCVYMKGDNRILSNFLGISYEWDNRNYSHLQVCIGLLVAKSEKL